MHKKYAFCDIWEQLKSRHRRYSDLWKMPLGRKTGLLLLGSCLSMYFGLKSVSIRWNGVPEKPKEVAAKTEAATVATKPKRPMESLLPKGMSSIDSELQDPSVQCWKSWLTLQRPWKTSNKLFEALNQSLVSNSLQGLTDGLSQIVSRYITRGLLAAKASYLNISNSLNQT